MEEYHIGSIYFHQILTRTRVLLGDQVMKDKVKMVMKDVRFLRMFCLCIEAWDFISDEQSNEILTSIMTPLEDIWIQEHNGRAIVDQQELSLLEGRIHQSKIQIQTQGCGNLLPFLMHMQCKPSKLIMNIDDLKINTMNDANRYLSLLIDNNEETDDVPVFKNHIGILTNMVVFLHESFRKVEYCTEWKNCIEFLNFARDFSIKALYLACFYWATKEENIEETATGMDTQIIPFAMMMLEFIPFLPDIIECYLGILRFTGNLPPSILLEETVASVVDFFFQHLSITLKDDFSIFRDHLIYIFTFISDHLRKNAKEEEEDDLIRNQIHALFREDPYLLLSFDEMKEDFSNNNMILRDFIIKIEIANANIRQRYYAFSYSWIGSKAVELEYLYFVFLQRALCAIEEDVPWGGLVQSQLQLYGMELRFLRVSLLWFAMLDDSDEEIKARLDFVIASLHRIWRREVEEKGFLAARLDAIRTGHGIAGWCPLASELKEKIELSKLEISTHLVNDFDWSFRIKSCTTSNKILKFLDSILHNLNAFASCIPGKIVPFKKQIQNLEDKLTFMQNMLKLAENCIDSKDLGEFIMLVQVFANEAARLTILYWVREANDKIAAEINLILSDMLQKIKPAKPDIVRLYFETLKAIYLKQSDDPILFGQTASIFVDFAFEDLVALRTDDFQALRDDVIFLLTFLNDPPSGNGKELVCSQIDNYFWEDVYGLLSIDDMKGDISKKKVLLDDFMMKIKTINAKIRKLYCEFPDSSMYNFPKITSPWYLDFLIQNLRNLKERMITDSKIALFVKYKIIKFEEELVSLSPFFNYVFMRQKELNETWLQVVDLVHLTERVINSCISSWFVFDHPVWYYMAYLSHVFDRIKGIKTKLEKIKDNTMHNDSSPTHSAGVNSTHLKQAWTSKINEVVVGFEEEAKTIIDDLTRGNKSFDIVSIVGMGGVGKTTLARKVSSSVKDDFHILAFYTVSQNYNIRMLLLGILMCIIKGDDGIYLMTNDDLAHKLSKCLSRKKYLIVLDDVWSTSVWNEIKRSFPDDQNGSRVMITTRSHDVASKCKIQCSPLSLRFLSKVESWKLLQMKVFENSISPPNLTNIGTQIAESCNGLPLAIVVIAGILAKTERSESSWSEIAEKVYSYLRDEGCIQILELSYNHLPEYLKICLLYLGAFPEDKLFRVNQVVRLWIAEGFVHNETKAVEDVAKDYFHDLVDRSLIVVIARGSSGEIKTFRVHDLIHKLCQTKCQEGNFFKLERTTATSSSMYDHYRTSILLKKTEEMPSGESSSSHGNVNTLLLFGHGAHDSLNSLMMKHKLVQVLYVENEYERYRPTSIQMVEASLVNLPTVVNLRHIEYDTGFSKLPSSISNFWNIQSLILTKYFGGIHYFPKTLWKMKSLRHVDVRECMLQFSDDHEHEQLDKVVSFSRPKLYSGKVVEQLLQRLPAVQKLRITLVKSLDYGDTLGFFRKLESLEMILSDEDTVESGSSYSIKFPSTLKKLKLLGLELPSTAISSIAKLHCLRVLKLQYTFFSGPRLEMKDVVFNQLIFFQLYDDDLEQWNASHESFPCLEQISIECEKLQELPPCFGEISSLKRISVIESSSQGVVDSAIRIQEEQMDYGNKVEVTIDKILNQEKPQ